MMRGSLGSPGCAWVVMPQRAIGIVIWKTASPIETARPTQSRSGQSESPASPSLTPAPSSTTTRGLRSFVPVMARGMRNQNVLPEEVSSATPMPP